MYHYLQHRAAASLVYLSQGCFPTAKGFAMLQHLSRSMFLTTLPQISVFRGGGFTELREGAKSSPGVYELISTPQQGSWHQGVDVKSYLLFSAHSPPWKVMEFDSLIRSFVHGQECRHAEIYNPSTRKVFFPGICHR